MAAGIDCVAVRNTFTVSQDFSGAWRMLQSIRELPGVLAGAPQLAGDGGDAPLHHHPQHHGGGHHEGTRLSGVIGTHGTDALPRLGLA